MTDLPLSLLLTAAFLYALFFVIRGAGESGVRRALTGPLLRPTRQQLVDAGSEGTTVAGADTAPPRREP